jgi:hypothetical protein
MTIRLDLRSLAEFKAYQRVEICGVESLQSQEERHLDGGC